MRSKSPQAGQRLPELNYLGKNKLLAHRRQKSREPVNCFFEIQNRPDLQIQIQGQIQNRSFVLLRLVW